MDISLFRRGIRLPRHEPSTSGSCESVTPPRVIKILMRQDAGPLYEPAVRVGDKVKTGEKVAESASGGADLHASISGEIKAVEKVLFYDGSYCKAILIESDGRDSRVESAFDSNALSASADELNERIRTAGVVQGGHGARTLFDMLSGADSTDAKPVAHIAVRFSDPDPYARALASATARLGNDVGDLSIGMELLKKITGVGWVHFVLDKKQRAGAVEKLAREQNCVLHRLDAFNYPSLTDPLVARVILGKEPEVALRPVYDCGVLIVDVDTLIDAVRAVTHKINVVEKIITVSGSSGQRSFRARVGTPLAEIVGAYRPLREIGKVVVGGLMAGRALHTLDFPLTKNVSHLTVLSPDEVSLATDEPCLSCGLCAMVCPMRLIPGMLSRYCEYDKWEDAEQAHLFTCVECGCCAYVCPAGRSVVQLVAHAKNEVLSMRRSSQ